MKRKINEIKKKTFRNFLNLFSLLENVLYAFLVCVMLVAGEKRIWERDSIIILSIKLLTEKFDFQLLPLPSISFFYSFQFKEFYTQHGINFYFCVCVTLFLFFSSIVYILNWRDIELNLYLIFFILRMRRRIRNEYV